MVVILAISAVEHLNSSILSNHEVKLMCRDQCTKQLSAFQQSKVTSLAKIESDIAIVDKSRTVNKLEVREARLLTGCNTMQWHVTADVSVMISSCNGVV